MSGSTFCAVSGPDRMIWFHNSRFDLSSNSKTQFKLLLESLEVEVFVDNLACDQMNLLNNCVTVSLFTSVVFNTRLTAFTVLMCL